MAEVLLKGGTVIDGTGAPRRQADVLIADKKIKGVGKGLGTKGQVIDVTGLTVTPGIIDPHTHLDGQFFFEPTGSSSCWHGVTTIMMGFCGYSLAPVKPEDRDYIIHMFARVEEVSPDIFKSVPFDWVTFPEYMDSLDRRGIGVNAIPQIGHSTMRYHVMGQEAVKRTATEAEVARMRQILHEAFEAGAFGFTTARAGPHIDWEGRPVPSRWASLDEFLALCDELKGVKAATLGYNPTGVLQGITEEDKHLMYQMVLHSGGKTMQIPGGARSQAARQFMLDAAKEGVKIYSVASSQPFYRVFTFAEGTVAFNSMDTWMRVMNSPTEERLKLFASREMRQKLRDEVDAEPAMDSTKMRQPRLNWEEMRVVRVAKPQNQRYMGMSVREIAVKERKHLADAMLDAAQADDWKLQLAARSVSEEAWLSEAQADLLRHPHLFPMNTDSGAHLANDCKTGDATYFLRRWVMEKHIMSLEDGVRKVTGEAARWIGLPDRGVLKEGMAADVAVFDLDKLECFPKEQVWDLPGGATRWVQRASGVQHVFVNGQQTIRDGKHTGALPGKMIRSTHYK